MVGSYINSLLKPFGEVIAESATFLAILVHKEQQTASTSSFRPLRVPAEFLKAVSLLEPDQLSPNIESSTAPSTLHQKDTALALSQNKAPTPQYLYTDRMKQYG